MSLNERLKFVRKNSRKTQAVLAKMLGISEGTIKRYEKDASKIPVEIVSKIALLCGADEIWLFTGKDINSIATRDEQETKSDSEQLNITRVIYEHQGVIKRFKDPKKAKEFNEVLVGIEEDDPEGYDELFKEAKTIYKTIKRLKEKNTTKKKQGQPVSKRRSHGE